MPSITKRKEYYLRDYQKEITARIHNSWADGKRSVMCQMPTGTGKTIVAANIVREWVHSEDESPKGCVLVVAHRREILQQTYQSLLKHGLEDELASSVVTIESIQKLSAEIKDGKYIPCPELVIVDEAHHATSATYKLLWEQWPKAHFLGMTATPCRMKKEGFTDLFDILVCSWPIKRFLMEGWLAEYKYVSIHPDSVMMERIRLLKKHGVDGDYQVKEMCSVMDNRASIEQLYSSYKKYANGRQGIIYAINRLHATHIKEYYEDRGESIMLIDSSTPMKQRDELMEEYRKGKIKIFVNCDIAGEGVDVPKVSFIQMARPTLSLNKYLQQVGRGLRPNPGRIDNTIILDNVGMYYMFGLPNQDRDWEKMFSVGQILPSKSDLLRQNGKNMTKEGLSNVSDGHNLDMLYITQDLPKSKQETNKKENLEVRRVSGKSNVYRLYKNGELVTQELFKEYKGFIDGFTQLWSKSRHCYCFFDNKGSRLLEIETTHCELIANGIVVVTDKWGHLGYYDLLMGEKFYALPNIKNVNNMSFIKERDGWHLRNQQYGHLTVPLEKVEQLDSIGIVSFKGSKDRYYVLGSSKTVLRLLGEEKDGSQILYDDRRTEGLFVRKNGKMQYYRNTLTGRKLYTKWADAINNVTPLPPLPNNFRHRIVADKFEIEVYTKDGLYGWRRENDFTVKAEYKDIVAFSDKYVVVCTGFELVRNTEGFQRVNKTIVTTLEGSPILHANDLYKIEGSIVWGDFIERYCRAKINLDNMEQTFYLYPTLDKEVVYFFGATLKKSILRGQRGWLIIQLDDPNLTFKDPWYRKGYMFATRVKDNVETLFHSTDIDAWEPKWRAFDIIKRLQNGLILVKEYNQKQTFILNVDEAGLELVDADSPMARQLLKALK